MNTGTRPHPATEVAARHREHGPEVSPAERDRGHPADHGRRSARPARGPDPPACYGHANSDLRGAVASGDARRRSGLAMPITAR